jgi:hypothetical protein
MGDSENLRKPGPQTLEPWILKLEIFQQEIIERGLKTRAGE